MPLSGAETTSSINLDASEFVRLMVKNYVDVARYQKPLRDKIARECPDMYAAKIAYLQLQYPEIIGVREREGSTVTLYFEDDASAVLWKLKFD